MRLSSIHACPILLLAAPLVGCTPTQSSVLPDDTHYLSVGIDPRAAIDEATRVLAPHGLAVGVRVDAPRFSAASYAGRSGRTALRVATERGMALALDADADEGALLSLDARTGTDLTADGAADVVIVRTESTRRCLALAEVDGEGLLRAAPTDPRWLDRALCIDELIDLTHDGRVEAIVEVPFRDLGVPAPSLRVPMTLDATSRFAPSAWPQGYALAEIARRDAQLEVALARGDGANATRLAIELALLSATRNGDDAEIDARLGLARGLALDTPQRARLDAAGQQARALRATLREHLEPDDATAPQELRPEAPETAPEAAPDPSSASASASG